MQARISCSPGRFCMAASYAAPAAKNLPLSARSLVAPTSAERLTHVPSVPWHRESAGLTLATSLPWRSRGTQRTCPPLLRPKCCTALQACSSYRASHYRFGPRLQMCDSLRWAHAHLSCSSRSRTTVSLEGTATPPLKRGRGFQSLPGMEAGHYTTPLRCQGFDLALKLTTMIDVGRMTLAWRPCAEAP